jgi:hypothetical protein
MAVRDLGSPSITRPKADPFEGFPFHVHDHAVGADQPVDELGHLHGGESDLRVHEVYAPHDLVAHGHGLGVLFQGDLGHHPGGGEVHHGHVERVGVEEVGEVVHQFQVGNRYVPG